MKIKDGASVSTMDFWYDLRSGGYIRPAELLEDPEDVKRVLFALEVLIEFEDSCEEQIEDFVQ